MPFRRLTFCIQIHFNKIFILNLIDLFSQISFSLSHNIGSESFVSKTALISDDAKIGDHCVIYDNVQIPSNIIISSNTFVIPNPTTVDLIMMIRGFPYQL